MEIKINDVGNLSCALFSICRSFVSFHFLVGVEFVQQTQTVAVFVNVFFPVLI